MHAQSAGTAALARIPHLAVARSSPFIGYEIRPGGSPAVYRTERNSFTCGGQTDARVRGFSVSDFSIDPATGQKTDWTLRKT
ncbi:hypothetical protein FQR65_LT20985 [Abscondita terminalis]|nr:hypothetical protein FQR65_LT20985 [Abscondita terminalis]